jgi:hypothetical protein
MLPRLLFRDCFSFCALAALLAFRLGIIHGLCGVCLFSAPLPNLKFQQEK